MEFLLQLPSLDYKAISLAFQAQLAGRHMIKLATDHISTKLTIQDWKLPGENLTARPSLNFTNNTHISTDILRILFPLNGS